VLSCASTGANAIWNVLSADDTLQPAEGLDVFGVPVPTELVGRTLQQSGIRASTGCTVVAIADGDRFHGNPDARSPLLAAADLVLIGDSDSEHRFPSRDGRRRPR
jgi:K+/H+ antiporter YhaU regulatory subunit KhtT